MDVVRLAFATQSDIFALVVEEEHQVGEYEGLAHWDGSTWQWIDRQTAWTLALSFHSAYCSATEFSGRVRIYSAGSMISAIDTGFNGLNESVSLGNELFAAGINGNFIRCSPLGCTRISHPISSHLYSIDASIDGIIYACGARGSILAYENGICRIIEAPHEYDLTSISCGKDGQTYAVGGRGDQGVLIDVGLHVVHPLPSRCQLVKTISKSEVYAIDLDGILWRWNGATAAPVLLPGTFHSLCFSRTGPTVAIGGKDAIAILADGAHRTIPFGLDAAWLSR